MHDGFFVRRITALLLGSVIAPLRAGGFRRWLGSGLREFT